MELSQYVASLARRWVTVVVGTLLGAIAGLFLSFLITPQYEAGTQLFVSSSGATDLSTAAQGGQFSQQRTASYAQLLSGRDLAGLVVDDLALGLTPAQLSKQISAQVLPETVILDVVVTDPSRKRALAIAESVGAQFSGLVERLESPPGTTNPPVQVSVVATPQVSTEPVTPGLVELMLAGALAGLLLGAVVAVVRDRLDTSVRDEAGAASAARAPVLALVPEDDAASAVGTELVVGPLGEAFRILRTNLQFVAVDAQPRVVMVTSSSQGEGKTTTAIHLAQALAQAGRRVLLVEADLRRPRVTRYLGLIGGTGMTNVLTRTVSLDDVLQPVGDGALTVLGAGPTPPNPSELLSSESMARLLSSLADDHDLVLVDAPPLLPVADAAGLAALCDGVLLCVRWGVTSREAVERSRALLDRAGAAVLGSVLTFVPRRSAGDYTYDYSDPAEDRRLVPRKSRRLSTADATPGASGTVPAGRP